MVPYHTFQNSNFGENAMGIVLGRVGPPGLHKVKLVDVVQVTGKFGKPAYEWNFSIVDGPHKGSTYKVTTGTELLLGTVFGDFLEMAYGRPIQEGDELDPVNDLPGKTFEARCFTAGKSTGGYIKTLRPVVE